uniref:Uncharacterized protein n=1 Tax=Lepeophtheirus salmonis TaxID=72036 RepID=A0A0K2VB78_LEPSM
MASLGRQYGSSAVCILIRHRLPLDYRSNQIYTLENSMYCCQLITNTEFLSNNEIRNCTSFQS